MKKLNVANRWNADLIDSYYSKWLKDSSQLDPNWQAFFEGFELASNGQAQKTNTDDFTGSVSPKKQARVIGAIYAYRSIGHTIANINPLLKEVPDNPRLSLDRLGLSQIDLDEEYDTGNYLGGVTMPLRELLDRLKKTYCGSIGVEYLHIQETKKRRWLQAKMEPDCNKPSFSREQQLRILRKIIEAEAFENFLHTRYVGQKRFSLEGGETLIACLDAIVEKSPEIGIDEIIMGMAHRGRLNVLANILGKSYEFIFQEFAENYVPHTIHGGGDVKYHLGYANTIRTALKKKIEIRLAANPSHLEAINPVVEGNVRAHQRLRGDTNRERVLPLLIHGDAAFAGQGIVTEVFNFSKLKGYRTGGTIHLVINNQIGFTTDPEDARSSRYCTDVAKIVEAPVFHVNGDDPLAVVMVAELAMDYRKVFSEDVVIDMYCYRKHGHNEADEPGFTHPLLYKKIARHPRISEILTKQLIDCEALTLDEAQKQKSTFQKILTDAFDSVKGNSKPNGTKINGKKFVGSTAEFQEPYHFNEPDTSVAVRQLKSIAKKLTQVPKDFKINPKVKRQLDQKWAVFKEGKAIDWAFAEALAFGTLMLEGTSIRLSGQDSERGTFSQRHAVLYDTETRNRYVPLLNLRKKQGLFCIYNSLLSEAAVLGFDFGYSIGNPNMLVLWEAQFGDFANGAQVIIDQFISSSESKWQRISSMVLLLPHGYEGQGPEHSSARLERFLQAGAEDNIQVCNVTTPAQYFHLLRRQMNRSFRKPLVVMAPKSLLRNKACTSPVSDFSSKRFECILDDTETLSNPQRLILCSGKVYYDLSAYRKTHQITNTAIIRIEQLYPLNVEELKRLLKKYSKIKKIIWCQEEPKNMGAWSYMMFAFDDLGINKKLHYVGRPAAASPAVGVLARHVKEQKTLVDKAFTL